MHFYLVGIKGAGMSALANILIDLGYKVSGVDYNKKYFTEASFRTSIHLESFNDYLLKEDYFYIIGNAFKLSDITKEIIDLNYRFEYYPQFLESFFKMKKIGIAGSHGKTTTTFFTSQLIDKPINTLVGDGTGFGNKDAAYFLFEACEYQNHFLNYTYDTLVILNIDYDHPDYFKNENEYIYAFQKAALNASFLLVNNDDNNCRKIVHSNKITFGFSPNSDIMLKMLENALSITFDGEEYLLPFKFYGKHMTYNLAAAFIVSYCVKTDISVILQKVEQLRLPKRRFTEHYIKSDLVLINDYAHHPTEIKAFISAARNKFPQYKLIVIYQGHTFSRTNAFLQEYANSLELADEIYIMPIFSSVREEEHDEWILLNMSNRFNKYSRCIKAALLSQSNTVIAFLGAGDIDNEFIFYK